MTCTGFKGKLVLSSVSVMGLLLMTGCSKKTSLPDLTGDPSGGKTTTDTPAVSTPERTEDNLNDVFNHVFFNFDDYSLSDQARAALAKNAALLKEGAAQAVTIEGHCDERGTVEYNLALGQRRADAARRYLINLGINADRLNTVSYGKERPFDPGQGETAWSQNRRAHFRSNSN